MSAASPHARPATVAPVFAALGDATRLELVARLSAGGPLSIARLSAGSAVTRQAVTKHLRVLAGAGLVRDERRGRECIWQLDPRRLEDARGFLGRMSDQWDAALDRLRAFVDGPPAGAQRATRRRKRSIPRTR